MARKQIGLFTKTYLKFSILLSGSFKGFSKLPICWNETTVYFYIPTLYAPISYLVISVLCCYSVLGGCIVCLSFERLAMMIFCHSRQYGFWIWICNIQILGIEEKHLVALLENTGFVTSYCQYQLNSHNNYCYKLCMIGRLINWSNDRKYINSNWQPITHFKSFIKQRYQILADSSFSVVKMCLFFCVLCDCKYNMDCWSDKTCNMMMLSWALWTCDLLIIFRYFTN